MCFCRANICGLLTIRTVMVLPASDLSMYGSGAVAEDEPPPEAEPLAGAEPLEGAAKPPPLDAGAAALAGAALLADAAPLPAGAAALAAAELGADDDAVPLELLLHAAVTSIAAQPAAIAALCDQRICCDSFRLLLQLGDLLVTGAFRRPAATLSVVAGWGCGRPLGMPWRSPRFRP